MRKLFFIGITLSLMAGLVFMGGQTGCDSDKGEEPAVGGDLDSGAGGGTGPDVTSGPESKPSPEPDADGPESGGSGSPAAPPFAPPPGPGSAGGEGSSSAVPTSLWSSPGLLSTDIKSNFTPSIAMDSRGNVSIVWVKLTGGQDDVVTKQYRAGANWDATETVLSAGSIDTVADPKIVLNEAGNKLVTWIQSGASHAVYAKRYNAGVWSSPENVFDSYSGDFVPRLAANSGGNMAIVFKKKGGPSFVMSRSIAARSWQFEKLEVPGVASESVINPDITNFNDSSFLVTWSVASDSSCKIQSRKMTSADSLGGIESVAGGCNEAKIVSNSKDKAIVFWKKAEGLTSNIFGTRNEGSVWSPENRISNGPCGGSVSDAKAFMDAAGNITVAWLHGSATGSYDGVCINRKPAGADWGTAEFIKNGINAKEFDLAGEAGGDVMAIWTELKVPGTPSIDIYTRRFTVAGGWSPAEMLVENKAVKSPVIAISGNSAIVAWMQQDGGVWNIYASRFSE